VNLEEVFATLQPSIVAFGSKLARAKDGKPPLFPPLIGTGFIVDAQGVVATNRHVAEALISLPANPATGPPSAFAIVFSGVRPEGEGFALEAQFVDIVGYHILDQLTSEDDYYGEAVPDLAFAVLRVKGVPAVKLAMDDWAVRIGMDIATAGFPLGEDPLVVHGVVGQATPLLRRGIVSGLNPFSCPQPHGFVIDAMSQGGASGSPIFRTDAPEVIGILHAGFPGTNITFAVTAYFIGEALRLFLEQAPLDVSDHPTLEELRSERTATRWSDDGGDWRAV
jgi:S1-C subfamily serine protease